MSPAGHGIVLRQIDRLFGEGTLTGLGDGPLLERYLTRRDEDAFEALVDLHGPTVLGLCRRMLRDPRDIEDAFQATFLVLARKAPTIRDRDLLSNWLYGVAYRVARRARARTLRRRERESAVGVPEIAAETEAERGEIGPMLDQELNRLPERYREPLVLCYLRGRTHEQAAADLRCPVGTVRSRLARGRDLLRDRLTRRGFAPSALGAVLGGDVSLPARLLIDTVPPPLAAATVRAAVGFGVPSILKAGAAAATSVVLARGVLTTMKLAQIKWIGLAVMMTGLSAGGVVAVGAASAPRDDGARIEDPAGFVTREAPQDKVEKRRDASTDDERRILREKVESLTKDNDLKTTEIANLNDKIRQINEDRALERESLTRQVREWRDKAERGNMKSPSPDHPVEPADARLKAPEGKIDGIPGRSIPAPPSDARNAPSQGGGAPPSGDTPMNGQPQARPAQGPSATIAPIQELEERLKVALLEYDYNLGLVKDKVISNRQSEIMRIRARIIVAQVESLDEETQDELDRLQLERRRKAAQLDKARAEEEVATALVSRNRVLNGRRPDMIAPEEVARADGQLKAAAAQKAIAEVEVAEVDLRMHQLSRRRDRIKEVIELAKPVR